MQMILISSIPNNPQNSKVNFNSNSNSVIEIPRIGSRIGPITHLWHFFLNTYLDVKVAFLTFVYLFEK